MHLKKFVFQLQSISKIWSLDTILLGHKYMETSNLAKDYLPNHHTWNGGMELNQLINKIWTYMTNGRAQILEPC